MCILATIILDSLNCYQMNARTMYNDNVVYNLILCFTSIYENLRNKRQITEKGSGYTNKIMYNIATNIPK